MPTPESAAFLAKKPTVPPTFDGVDYDDNKRLKQAQDAVIREQWVQVMMGRLVREELSKCYYREGVNHLEKCGSLREKYLQMLKDHRVPSEPQLIGQSALKAPTTPIQNFWSVPNPLSQVQFLAPNHQNPTNCPPRPQQIAPLRRASRWTLPIRSRPISSTATRPSAAAAATETTADPQLSTPLADSQDSAAPEEALSSCPAGTILTGLNYFKNQNDPVALADSEYPQWLWKCLDVQKKADEGEADDAGDEFSKSKKQRRLAMKRQRIMEAKLVAEGNLEALAPKIPLQHQTINLPANDAGTPEGALAAAAAREELRRAMRRERKAKIKESNYLKSM
ncbi:hypothetical protein ONZ43_g7059 [Nemania bipapillata]|uniref:Uncharacterized protein n=1 Tax=Nemania bipapillata TaxID=110536 RepID=A0ACC2HTN2_9PEZI|nr:hypothetical protein ONZ43_g7059 [Nemania bipapillata]